MAWFWVSTQLHVFAEPRSQEEPEAFWEVTQPPEAGWTVGDQIPLILTIHNPQNSKTTLPQFPKNWGDFEVIEQINSPAEITGNIQTQQINLLVTLWSPGEHITLQDKIPYETQSGEAKEIIIPPVSITINSVLQEADPQKHDLKPQAVLPRPPIWPWLVLGIAVVVGLYFLLRWLIPLLRNRKTNQELIPAVEEIPDLIPPYRLALDELKRIQTLRLPEKGAFKTFYTLISDCLRNYIEQGKGFPALESTTSELMQTLRSNKAYSADILQQLHQILEEADLVKFARAKPGIPQADASMQQAFIFIEQTRPVIPTIARTPADQSSSREVQS
ncbi:MAG: hypothetical protein JEZ06_15410 [Anaerolineaceae bacterium]|nr:hypothetical protein [Anaerolineaceae bacterium]